MLLFILDNYSGGEMIYEHFVGYCHYCDKKILLPDDGSAGVEMEHYCFVDGKLSCMKC